MLRLLIDIFVLLLVLDAVLSFVPNPEIQRHPFVRRIRQMGDVVLRPIRQLLPQGLPFDPSPLILILLLRLLQNYI